MRKLSKNSASWWRSIEVTLRENSLSHTMLRKKVRWHLSIKACLDASTVQEIQLDITSRQRFLWFLNQCFLVPFRLAAMDPASMMLLSCCRVMASSPWMSSWGRCSPQVPEEKRHAGRSCGQFCRLRGEKIEIPTCSTIAIHLRTAYHRTTRWGQGLRYWWWEYRNIMEYLSFSSLSKWPIYASNQKAHICDYT